MIVQCLIRILKATGDIRTPGGGMVGEARSVLIVETTRFGDLMAALPAVQRLRSRFRTASFTMLVDASNASILDALDFPCTVVPLSVSNQPLRSVVAFSRIRSARFDLACSMSPSRKNAVLTLASRARCKVGYFTHLKSATPFLEPSRIESVGCDGVPIQVSRGDSLYTRASRIADYAGAPPLESSALRIRPSLEIGWQRLRARLALPPGNRIVLVHPFAAWRYRAWPSEQIPPLISMLRDFDDVSPVVVGSPQDFGPKGSVLRAQLAASGAAIHASDSWADTALLLSHSSAFVGTDSGPVHLAAALGIPVIGLYGPAPPALTAPPALAGQFLYSQMPCSPCDQKRCVAPDDSCMSRLTPRQAFDALAPILRQTSGVVANG